MICGTFPNGGLLDDLGSLESCDQGTKLVDKLLVAASVSCRRDMSHSCQLLI